jgi:ribosomal protein S27E
MRCSRCGEKLANPIHGERNVRPDKRQILYSADNTSVLCSIFRGERNTIMKGELVCG